MSRASRACLRVTRAPQGRGATHDRLAREDAAVGDVVVGSVDYSLSGPKRKFPLARWRNVRRSSAISPGPAPGGMWNAKWERRRGRGPLWL